METRTAEIAAGVYRLSTFVPQIASPAGFTFNQFLVLGDEPLLFHTGLRRMFPLVRAALARIIPPEQLRWICFGHYEADECGAMNCGDLFTQLGDDGPLTEGDVVGPAIAAEDLFHASSLAPTTGATVRRLGGLSPRTLALMHGPSFAGDGAAALRALADDYDRRVRAALA